jgi:flagellar basal-body rod modification protein FlgD
MTINSTGAETNKVAGTATTAATPQSASSMDKLANENTFLQLFVSQLKNQDPLNPSDGTQFVSQLAQFSELEQVIGINQNVGAIRTQMTGATSTAASVPNDSTPRSGATSDVGASTGAQA